MYGKKLGTDTISMRITIILKADSTYTITNTFNHKGRCKNDSIWYNTGRWITEKRLIFFSIDKRIIDDGLDLDAEYPIEHVDQIHIELNKKELKSTLRIPEKYNTDILDYSHYLKVDENGFLKCTYSWDCFEEIWKTRRINKL